MIIKPVEILPANLSRGELMAQMVRLLNDIGELRTQLEAKELELCKLARVERLSNK